MEIRFVFRYDAGDQSKFEAQKFCGNFRPLMQGDQDVLSEFGLWTSFVAEFQADGDVFKGWTWNPIYPSRAKWVRPETVFPPFRKVRVEKDRPGHWGPSKPIDAVEVRDWATRWLAVLATVSEKGAVRLFDYFSHLYEPGGDGRLFMMTELVPLAAQADCAIRHGVRLRMSMMWDE